VLCTVLADAVREESREETADAMFETVMVVLIRLLEIGRTVPDGFA